MKPTTFFSAIFILFVFLTGCQKDPEIKPQPEQGYPTTYKPLSQSEWETLNSEFQKVNVYEGLALNEFGFVKGEILLNKSDSITPEFVIGKVDALVEHYQDFMGIPHNYLLNIETDIKGLDYYFGIDITLEIHDFFDYIQELEKYNDESIKDFYFVLHQTHINGYEMYGPNLSFRFILEENKLIVGGNYFPNALIPENQIYTLADAITTSCQFIQKETGIDLWESKHKFESSKIFVLNYSDENVEIRECWKIRVFELEGLNFVYIDTQTGEILSWCIECFYI